METPPTASQAYLAADILSSFPNDPGDRNAFTLRAQAAAVLTSALCTPGWTGSSPSCAEYGKPPAAADPGAVEAVSKLTALKAFILSRYPNGSIAGRASDAPPADEKAEVLAEVVRQVLSA